MQLIHMFLTNKYTSSNYVSLSNHKVLLSNFHNKVSIIVLKREMHNKQGKFVVLWITFVIPQ